MKTRLLLKEPFDFLPSIAQRCTPIGISEVVLPLLLIAVAFYTSRGIRLFASGPQIPAGGFGLKHISTSNYSFALLRLRNPVAVFLLPLVDPIILHGRRRQPRQACGGGNPGREHADEPASPMHEVRVMTSAHGDDL